MYVMVIMQWLCALLPLCNSGDNSLPLMAVKGWYVRSTQLLELACAVTGGRPYFSVMGIVGKSL